MLIIGLEDRPDARKLNAVKVDTLRVVKFRNIFYVKLLENRTKSEYIFTVKL